MDKEHEYPKSASPEKFLEEVYNLVFKVFNYVAGQKVYVENEQKENTQTERKVELKTKGFDTPFPVNGTESDKYEWALLKQNSMPKSHIKILEKG